MMLEEVRELAEQAAAFPDDELNFYAAALVLGLSEKDADAVCTHLTERVMRARGMI